MDQPTDSDQAYHPNAVPLESVRKPGLGCFIDQARLCGVDCMAYLPQVPDQKAYLGETWAHCLLLLNADRIGRHLVVLVDIAKSTAARSAQRQSEAARQQPSPTVR